MALWKLIATGLFFTIAFGCGQGDSGAANPPAAALQEPTPDDLAKELGVPNEPGPRALKKSEFGRYSLVVDVFRRSAALPPLGAFDERYVDLLTPADSGTPSARMAKARAKFNSLAATEFATVSIDGKVAKLQIVSGALEGIAEGGFRTTPPGAYKLDVLRYTKKYKDAGGAVKKDEVDFPWIQSAKFHNSAMYWGLWIFGGYFIHSTPHYGQLGSPASMGCVRESFPDAMELFKLRQTHLGMIRIHPIGSRQAYDRLREITSPEWTMLQLAENRAKINAYIKYQGSEVNSQGHAWIDPETRKPGAIDWPECGPVDCFGIWGRKASSRD